MVSSLNVAEITTLEFGIVKLYAPLASLSVAISLPDSSVTVTDSTVYFSLGVIVKDTVPPRLAESGELTEPPALVFATMV